MADAVAPSGAPAAEVGVVVEDVLVDVTEHQLGIRRTEDGHGDQSDVAVLRFGFFNGPVQGPRVEFASGDGSNRIGARHRRVQTGGVRQEERAEIMRHSTQMQRQGCGRRKRMGRSTRSAGSVR